MLFIPMFQISYIRFKLCIIKLFIIVKYTYWNGLPTIHFSLYAKGPLIILTSDFINKIIHLSFLFVLIRIKRQFILIINTELCNFINFISEVCFRVIRRKEIWHFMNNIRISFNCKSIMFTITDSLITVLGP